jgi:hypothetical protein
MIDRDHELPVSRQCAALGISRGSVYYEAVSVSESDLALMRKLDELHLEHPQTSVGKWGCPTLFASVYFSCWTAPQVSPAPTAGS